MAFEVVAQSRKGQGRGASRRLRHSGKVPGILYGGKKPALNIELDHNPLYHQLRNEKFHASVLTLARDAARNRFFLGPSTCLRSRMKLSHSTSKGFSRTRRSKSRCRCHSATAK